MARKAKNEPYVAATLMTIILPSFGYFYASTATSKPPYAIRDISNGIEKSL
jgi:hypothetical protein